MVYQRGTGSVELELSRVQSCLEVVDPKVDDLADRVDSLEATRDKIEGKFTVIVWLVGVNITLMLSLLVALFTWGLNHITVRVYDVKPQLTSTSIPQNAKDQ
jgi:hypothetical protein